MGGLFLFPGAGFDELIVALLQLVEVVLGVGVLVGFLKYIVGVLALTSGASSTKGSHRIS